MDPIKASEVKLRGYLWRRSSCDLECLRPVHGGADCPLLDLADAQAHMYNIFPLRLRARRPVVAEPAKATAKDSVLFEAVLKPSSFDADESHEIAELPVRHVVLEEGEITKPLLLHAVKRHVVTLGLVWQDAALHLPRILADLPASAPLRHIAISFSDDHLHKNTVSQVTDALISSSRIDGIYFTGFLRHEDVLVLRPCVLRLCDSMTYLSISSVRLITEIKDSRRGQRLGWLDFYGENFTVESIRNRLIPERNESRKLDWGMDFNGESFKIKQLRMGFPFHLNGLHKGISLTRLDLRDYVKPPSDRLPFEFIEKLVNLTDLGLNIEDDLDVQDLSMSRVLEKILVLRLRISCSEPPNQASHQIIGRISSQSPISSFIVECLTSPRCTIKFFDYIGNDFQWLELLASSRSRAHCAALRIHNVDKEVADSMLTGLTKLLCSAVAWNILFCDCRIDREGKSMTFTQGSDSELQVSLNDNFILRHFNFPWSTPGEMAYATSLLQRNEIYRDSQLLTEQRVKPNVAKIFMCGHSEVGKTTLTRALVSRRSPDRLNFGNPKTDRTRGMRMHSLGFQGHNKKLLICDLAGQEEFHVFHHYFMNASNNDIFVVVCKHDHSATSDVFRQQLEYWLRFIVSHRGSRKMSSSALMNHTENKPKVIVIVNFFQQAIGKDTITYFAREWTSEVTRRFSSALDFGSIDDQNQDTNLFGVNARTSLGVGELHARLKSSLILSSRTALPIPKLCYDISTHLTGGKSWKNWLSINKFASKAGRSKLLLTTDAAVGEALSIERIKVRAALLELHIQGNIIYFPPEKAYDHPGGSNIRERESAAEDNTLVIIDTNWFSNELIGTLLGTHLKSEIEHCDKWKWRREDIKYLLHKQGCPDVHLEEIMRYLLRLELCVALKKTQDGEVDECMFPALLTDKVIKFPRYSDAISTKFFGRRLRCKESTHLIPFAVFTRLQSKLHKAYHEGNASFKMGYGWVSFMSGSVGVVVRFGGDLLKDAWESKQWVDILTFCPAERNPPGFSGWHKHDARFVAANQVVDAIRSLFYATCKGGGLGGIPTVMIEEMVLQNQKASSGAIPVIDVLDRARTKGLLEGDQEWGEPFEATPVLDLLLPLEIKECVLDCVSVISSIQMEFFPKTTEKGSGDDEIPKPPEIKLTGPWAILDKRVQTYCREMRTEMSSQFSVVNKSLETIRAEIGKLSDDLQKMKVDIIANCSTRLLRHELRKDRTYPMYPYLVDVQGRLAPLKELMGMRQVRVHFLCESSDGGPHPVDGQPGKVVTWQLAPWVAKASRVMVPAVTVICCLARLAAAVYLPSANNFLPTPQALVSGLGLQCDALQQVILPVALDALVHGLPGVEAKHLMGCRPDAQELQSVLAAVLGDHDSVDMWGEFKLKRVIFDDDTPLWVCRQHAIGRPEAISGKNPFRWPS